MESPANQQFPIIPRDKLDKLGKKYACSTCLKMNDVDIAVRFCTSWTTRDEDVRALVEDIEKV